MTMRELRRLIRDMSPNRHVAEVRGMMRDAVFRSGLQQGQFAGAIGCSPAQLSRYVNGRTTPRATTLVHALWAADRLELARAHGAYPPPVAGQEMRLRLGWLHHDHAVRAAMRCAASLREIQEDSRLDDDTASVILEAWHIPPGDCGAEWAIGVLAALVADAHDTFTQPVPEWVERDPLDPPFVWTGGWRSRREVIRETRPGLAQYNVHIAADEVTPPLALPKPSPLRWHRELLPER